MSRIENKESLVETVEREASLIVEGELMEISSAQSDAAKNIPENKPQSVKDALELTKNDRERLKHKAQSSNQRYLSQYVFLPLIFLTVALLGGLRFGAQDREFVFLKPELVCLIFASVLLVLFFRADLLRLSGWFSESFSTIKNVSNAVVLLTLYAASVQIFNSLLPEKGLPFWVVGFFFFWTLWNNLFSVFDAKRLLQSLGALFGLAFVVKYLVLANLVSDGETWTQKILESLVREASFGLLDLPRYAPATGYAQFFALALYVIGLFLLRPRTEG